MASITLKGNPIETIGNLPANGAAAPGFTLVKTDLSELKLSELSGQTIIVCTSKLYCR